VRVGSTAITSSAQWHNWKFHCVTGEGEPGYEADCVPRYEIKVEGRSAVGRSRERHEAEQGQASAARSRAAGGARGGPMRVAGISTTVMDEANPRYSTSDALLHTAIEHAKTLGAEAKMIRLNA